MNTQYLIKGSTIKVVKLPSKTLQPSIPPAVYTVVQTEEGFALEFMQDSFETPSKLYGTVGKRSSRIVDTFLDRDCSTGVAITGLKGAGKSELAKQTCNKVIAAGFPIVMINEPYSGSEFNTFIKDLGVIGILYDEFAKIFKKDKEGKKVDSSSNQDQLLTLFDGTIPGRRLIVITENSTQEINHYFMLRPGRLFYHYQYEKLEDAVVIGYIKDLKLKKKFAKEVIDYSRSSREFTFDSLKAICEQKLRYNESLAEITAELNVVTKKDKEYQFRITKLKSSDPRHSADMVIIENFDISSCWDLRYKVTSRVPGEPSYPDLEEVLPREIVYSDDKTIIYKSGAWTIMGVIEEKPAKPAVDFDAI